jgi:hypothetical protein
MKTCHKCKLEKPLDCFSKDNGNNDGLYSWCKECVSKHNKNNRVHLNSMTRLWRANNVEYVRKYSSEYEKNNKQKRSVSRKKRRDADPDKVKHKSLLRTFNLALTDYNKMLAEQNNVCAICGKDEVVCFRKSNKTMSLAVDHDHKTGKIRGLLCKKCNTAIGMFYDNIDLLTSAIKYLEKHNAKISNIN